MSKNYRDAGTGKFVTKSYADSHKRTTVGESKGAPKGGGSKGKGKKGK